MSHMIRIYLVCLMLLCPTGFARAAGEGLSAEANQAFLRSNAAASGVVSRPSGLQYRVLHSGVGRHPGPIDQVQVTYSARLINGVLFDGTSPGLPATLTVNGILPGMSEALQLMHEGDHWQIVVPPSLGFGPHGSANGAIPPNQVLVLEVTLISTHPLVTPQPSDPSSPLSIATAGREQKAVLTLHPGQ